MDDTNITTAIPAAEQALQQLRALPEEQQLVKALDLLSTADQAAARLNWITSQVCRPQPKRSKKEELQAADGLRALNLAKSAEGSSARSGGRAAMGDGDDEDDGDDGDGGGEERSAQQPRHEDERRREETRAAGE